jgi:hypothetical protein
VLRKKKKKHIQTAEDPRKPNVEPASVTPADRGAAAAPTHCVAQTELTHKRWKKRRQQQMKEVRRAMRQTDQSDRFGSCCQGLCKLAVFIGRGCAMTESAIGPADGIIAIANHRNSYAP